MLVEDLFNLLAALDSPFPGGAHLLYLLKLLQLLGFEVSSLRLKVFLSALKFLVLVQDSLSQLPELLMLTMMRRLLNGLTHLPQVDSAFISRLVQ